MYAFKRIIAAGFVMAIAAFGLTIRADGQGREGREQNSKEVRGIVNSVDAGSITLSFPEGRENVIDKTYLLAKDVEFAIGTGIGGGGVRGGGGGVYKAGNLKDLAAGVLVSLSLTADLKTVESIVAEGPMVKGVLKAVDAKKKTVTVSAPPQREPVADDTTYTIADDAEILVDDGRGRRFSLREGKLDDLADGAIVTLRLSLDKKQVQSVHAEGALVMGTIKAVNPAKKSVTLETRPARGDDGAEERTLMVSADAVVLVDDGKGRRLSLKETKLADLPIGASAALKLSVDQAFVMMMRVEGPMVMGLFKSADADKGTITIAIPKGRDDADEKTFTLTKDATVLIDGAASKLANLKAGENGPMIQLRLALDQKSVQVVTARQNQPR